MRLRIAIAFLVLFQFAGTAFAQDEHVCPLSQEQSDKSIQAFAKLVPLFQHPRCINCHGDVNPFDADNSNHEGGNFEEKDNPDCSGCHTLMPKWRLAPQPMWFINKSEEELCEQEHFMFRYAQLKPGEESFMGHMINDNQDVDPNSAPFIETGLIGNRAMTDKDLEPGGKEPPPGWDHVKLVADSLDWVGAMGGRFHGDKSCGCKKSEYVLRLIYAQTLDINFGLIKGQDVKSVGVPNAPYLDIPLKAKEQGTLEGTGQLVIKDKGRYSTMIGGCAGQGDQTFNITATAKIDEGKEEDRGESDKMSVTFKCEKVQHEFKGACAGKSGSSSGSSACDAAGVKLDFNPPTLGKTASQKFATPVPNSYSVLIGQILKNQ